MRWVNLPINGHYKSENQDVYMYEDTGGDQITDFVQACNTLSLYS